VADSVITALDKIAAYAGTAESAPSKTDYSTAGVSDVSDTNLSAINTAIKAQRGADNTDGNTDDRNAADTAAEVQAIVSAYNVILTAADGQLDDDAQPTQAQYGILGVTDIDLASETSLLGSVIDGKASTAVDTVAKVQDLADLVDFFLGVAAEADDNYSGQLPTVAQWESLGVIGVTEANLESLNSLLYASDGSGGDAFMAEDFDTVEELQDWATLFAVL